MDALATSLPLDFEAMKQRYSSLWTYMDMWRIYHLERVQRNWQWKMESSCLCLIGWNQSIQDKEEKRAIREAEQEKVVPETVEGTRKAGNPFREPTKQQKAEAVEHADTAQETIRPELVISVLRMNTLGKADRSRNFVPIWKR